MFDFTKILVLLDYFAQCFIVLSCIWLPLDASYLSWRTCRNRILHCRTNCSVSWIEQHAAWSSLRCPNICVHSKQLHNPSGHQHENKMIVHRCTMMYIESMNVHDMDSWHIMTWYTYSGRSDRNTLGDTATSTWTSFQHSQHWSKGRFRLGRPWRPYWDKQRRRRQRCFGMRWWRADLHPGWQKRTYI